MVKEFTVGVSHTVNLGNYESIRIEASVTLDCGDWETTRAEAQIALCELLDETFNAQKSPAWFSRIPAKQARK